MRINADGRTPVIDTLAVEEPLEIRMGDGRQTLSKIITMRTPGHDLDLAAGWLVGEGVVQTADDIISVRACTDRELSPEERGNVVTVDLRPAAALRLGLIDRTSDVSSACGVCGSSSLARVRERGLTPVTVQHIDDDVLTTLTDRLKDEQRVFTKTGGLHGAALATVDGTLLVTREDVGRHNAVDKVIGSALLSGSLARAAALVVSSRGSFEIAQKAVAARIGTLVTVSAPSTLAVDLAHEFGLQILGFAREGRATIY